MSTKNSITREKLKRFTVAGIPLIKSITDKLAIGDILAKYIKPYGNEKIPVIDTLLLLIWNITLGRQPLYELEQWIKGIDSRCHGLSNKSIGSLNDDRFGRALDKLYFADRASLMTEIVIKMIHAVDLDISRIHNDSTTVKAYGKIPGTTRTGLRLARGNSKDHRPDLKQLVFTLTISSDGAVPVHYKSYPGNRTDDTTHIETWDTLRKLLCTNDFIYVADCKVCTSMQLGHITGNGGRVITIMPDTWNESKAFKDSNRLRKRRKKLILKREIISHLSEYETFSIFSGDYRTNKAGYRIYWFYSSEKSINDFLAREDMLQKAERKLFNLIPKLNKRSFITRKAIEDEIQDILKKHNVNRFFDISISERTEEDRFQIGRGRPGPDAKYRISSRTVFSLSWKLNKEMLKKEKNVDGIFPLITTDDSLSAKDVLLSYKYQPKLEKRFTQFKSVHEAAPLLFKKIERVESIMFLFFLSLIVQAIIEREVRSEMKIQDIDTLSVYPEFRKSYFPTTSKILDCFDGISSYQIIKNNQIIKEYKDDLNSTQEKILKLLNINSNYYWGYST